jgi:hypothetical protein
MPAKRRIMASTLAPIETYTQTSSVKTPTSSVAIAASKNTHESAITMFLPRASGHPV